MHNAGTGVHVRVHELALPAIKYQFVQVHAQSRKTQKLVPLVNIKSTCTCTYLPRISNLLKNKYKLRTNQDKCKNIVHLFAPNQYKKYMQVYRYTYLPRISNLFKYKYKSRINQEKFKNMVHLFTSTTTFISNEAKQIQPQFHSTTIKLSLFPFPPAPPLSPTHPSLSLPPSLSPPFSLPLSTHPRYS